MKKQPARVMVNVFVDNESEVTAKTLQRTSVEVVTIGNHLDTHADIFVQSREAAERLFDAVAEMTMRWRERDPEVIPVDAVIKEEPPKNAACTGYIFKGEMQHDGDTCPIHEGGEG
jgi:hypothetical protein